jgi:carbon monoxide dehydrogenase subunit G
VHIQGEKQFDAPPEDVFRALTDAHEMAEAFPAIERVEVENGDWTVYVRLPVPGFRVRFSVHLEDLREPEHARLQAWGKSLGGRVSVDTSFDLAPADGGTHMRWSAEVAAAGLFSGLGNQSLGPLATHQADKALGHIARRLEPARAR